MPNMEIKQESSNIKQLIGEQWVYMALFPNLIPLPFKGTDGIAELLIPP